MFTDDDSQGQGQENSGTGGGDFDSVGSPLPASDLDHHTASYHPDKLETRERPAPSNEDE